VSTPFRQLYRVVYSKETAVPATRSGVVNGYHLLEAAVPYIMTGKLVERVMLTDPNLKHEPIQHKPFHPNVKNVLIFFPGGIGDVIALRPCLEKFKETYPGIDIGVVSTMADQCLIGDLCTLWDYPIREEVANYYEAWVNIAEHDRASVGRELQDSFSEYLQVESPRRVPSLPSNPIREASLRSFIRDEGRVSVGVHLHSQCHFRSIPNTIGCLTMMALVERGCDCYVLGTSSQRLLFVDKNKQRVAPPDHIYETNSFLEPLELSIAFRNILDVTLTADTAGLHIAGALQKPCLGVFGLTDGKKRCGYYPTVDFVQGIKECSPCEHITEEVPCPHPNCLALAEMNPFYLADKVMEVYEKYGKGN